MRFGAVFYRGPSLLTGDSIVGIASGLNGESKNPKTGPMVQTYVLRSDQSPMDAVRSGADDAICGDCKLRGDGAYGRRCYVTPFMGPLQIYKKFVAGTYPDASWSEIQALVEGRAVRLCAYGDPTAIPFEVWRSLLATASTWTGYSHFWKRCDPRFKTICMASVDTEHEFHLAHLMGWRTFRVRKGTDPLVLYRAHKGPLQITAPLEFICPASDESQHRSTCQQCQLCRGTSSPARSVAIIVHGKPGNLKAFGVDPRGLFGGRPRKASPPPAEHIESTLNPHRIPLTVEPLRAKFYRPGELR